jgi:hypothetical protein
MNAVYLQFEMDYLNILALGLVGCIPSRDLDTKNTSHVVLKLMNLKTSTFHGYVQVVSDLQALCSF